MLIANITAAPLPRLSRFPARLFTLLLALALITSVAATEPPTIRLNRGDISATIYLPHAETGRYRSSRFDWSGMVASLEFAGHRIFGEWKLVLEPGATDSDAIGTAGEFGIQSPLGFDEAPEGGAFYKIGVGRLTRPDAEPFHFSRHYAVDPLPWTIRNGEEWAEFFQELPEENGWGYHYTKRVAINADGRSLTIDYRLKNTGSKRIDTDFYSHNFVVLDSMEPAPGTRVRLDFEPADQTPIKDLATVTGDTIEFVGTLPPATALMRRFTDLADGEGKSATIENAAVGIRITTDATPGQAVFFSVGRAVCFEPVIRIELAPGESMAWSDRYEPFVKDRRRPPERSQGRTPRTPTGDDLGATRS